MGAHYMFLANMLYLDTHIDVKGTSKGKISDAPLGFIVLDTDNNTKTFIPAGGTVTAMTAVFHSHFWPLKLDIRLPPQTPAVQVRAFMQELDQLLFWDGRFLPRHASSSVVEPPPAFSAANRSNRSSSVGPAHGDDTSKMLFELNLQEENQVVQRARGDDSYIALRANERWLIHFSIFIKGKRKPRFRQIRAAVRPNERGFLSVTPTYSEKHYFFLSNSILTPSQGSLSSEGLATQVHSNHRSQVFPKKKYPAIPNWH